MHNENVMKYLVEIAETLIKIKFKTENKAQEILDDTANYRWENSGN